jgi:hypothetical protein
MYYRIQIWKKQRQSVFLLQQAVQIFQIVEGQDGPSGFTLTVSVLSNVQQCLARVAESAALSQQVCALLWCSGREKVCSLLYI